MQTRSVRIRGWCNYQLFAGDWRAGISAPQRLTSETAGIRPVVLIRMVEVKLVAQDAYCALK